VNKITISDIAKHAGVSKTSVSYVLSGRKKLSAEVEERIMAAVAELGYTAPTHSSRLMKEPPKIINYCLPLEKGTLDDDPYYIPLIEGAMDYSASHGYHMIITRLTKGDEIAEGMFYSSFPFVNGVILCNLQIDHLYEQALIDNNIPYVVNGTPENINTKYYVDADIEGIAYQAATYLLKKGHRKIFYINLAEHLLQSKQRLSGFKLAYQDFDLPWDDSYHRFCNVNVDDSAQLVRSILNDKSYHATAIVASSEIQAWGAIQKCQELQISIPQQMAIVSMGGSSLSNIGYPNLTTIDFSPRKIGMESAKMLIEVIERKRIRPSQLIVPGKLIERESV
jgi:LacI family transcriptional regulator